jgi:hypothetical protein
MGDHATLGCSPPGDEAPCGSSDDDLNNVVAENKYPPVFSARMASMRERVDASGIAPDVLLAPFA